MKKQAVMMVVLFSLNLTFAAYTFPCPPDSRLQGDCCICGADSFADQSSGRCRNCNSYCTSWRDRDDRMLYTSGEMKDESCFCYTSGGVIAILGGAYGSCLKCEHICKGKLGMFSNGTMKGEVCECECNAGYDIDKYGYCAKTNQTVPSSCNETCKRMDARQYGVEEGGKCSCYCQGGYLKVNGGCISEEEYIEMMCDDFCQDLMWNAYGEMKQSGCSCYCKPGYEKKDGKCTSPEESCNMYCKNYDVNSYGLMEGECKCHCINGYWAEEGKCMPAKRICEQECSSHDANSYGVPTGDECNCYCKDGYILEGGICVADADVAREKCSEYCSNVPNTKGVMSERGCHCECMESYVAVDGACEENIDEVPSLEELEREFSSDDASPERPKVPLLDEKTKKKIKKYLGLDVDQFSRESGAGKKAYVIRSNALSGREALSVGKKSNLMIAFFQELGYDVRYLDRDEDTQVFQALADPNTAAVAYFGHGEKGTPSVEDQDADDLPQQLLSARMRYYEMKGLSKSEARSEAMGEAQTTKLDMFYAHTCYSADVGFERLANQLLRPGGVYYGERGRLWTLEYPDIEYVKPY